MASELGVWRRHVLTGVVVSAILAGCATPSPGPDSGLARRTELLLWQAPYRTIVLDIDYARDPPSELALTALVESIGGLTGKPIEVDGPTLLPVEYRASREWSHDALAALDEATRVWGQQFPYGIHDTARIHVVYLLGTAREPKLALGLAIDGAAFVFDSTSPMTAVVPSLVPSGREVVERAVVIHEVGHVLGLLNHGTPMVTPREDPDSPHHSKNRESVMYGGVDIASAQTTPIIPENAPPYQFDADDLADIRYAQSLEPKPR